MDAPEPPSPAAAKSGANVTRLPSASRGEFLRKAVVGGTVLGGGALLAARPETAEAAPASRGLYNITDAPFNVKVDGTGDQTAAVNYAIRAASEGGPGGFGGVFHPGGTVRCLGEVYMPPQGSGITMLGVGQRGSVFYWPRDLGPEKFGFQQYGAGAGIGGFTLKGLGLLGPGSTTRNLGVRPCNMSGVLLSGGVRVLDCTIIGFNSGLHIMGDHVAIRDTTCSNNYYGAYWGPAAGVARLNMSRGDVEVTNCDFTNNNMASVGLAANNRLEFAHLYRNHFGFAPFCFYKEANATTEITLGCTFIGCSFEFFGNAAFYDESYLSKIAATIFLNCGTSGYPMDAYKLGSKPARATFDVQTITDTEWRNPGTGALYTFGTEALARCDGMSNTFFQGMAAGFLYSGALSKPVFKLQGITGEPNARFEIEGYQHPVDNGCSGRLYRAGATCTIGQLLSEYFVGPVLKVHPFAFDDTIPAGVMGQYSCANNDAAPVIDSGVSRVKVHASNSVAAMKWVKPDLSHAGCVVEASGPSDNAIGISRDVLLPSDPVYGRCVPVELRLGRG